MVHGHCSGEWICSAEVIDAATQGIALAYQHRSEPDAGFVWDDKDQDFLFIITSTGRPPEWPA
jgi:hypothetical protein